MDTLLKSTLFFFIASGFFCCKSQTGKVSTEIKYNDYINTLRAKTDKIIISFYVDYYNSEIRLTYNPITEKSKLDSTFLFIDSFKNDACNLNSNLKPDGLISFYKKDSLVGDFAFVLFDSCHGLYSDFTSKPQKYTLSNSGRQELIHIKEQMFQSITNNR